MINSTELHQSVSEHLKSLQTLHLHELLHRYQLLTPLLRQLAEEQLAQAASFTPDEEQQLFEQVWQGLPSPAPIGFNSEWPEELSDVQRQQAEQKIQQLRLQKRMNELYNESVEPYFLKRRADLERVTYRVIRVKQMGLAEELYLRVIEGEQSFEVLAHQHSVGEERMSSGLMGPMSITDPHPDIGKVLRRLSPGEVHAPIAIDRWFVILRMEEKEPASLTKSLRLELQREMLNQGILPMIEEVLEDLLRSPQSQPQARAMEVKA